LPPTCLSGPRRKKETVGSGTAATEFEARTAANEIVKRIEAKSPEAP
jgi:hypothetical protein